MRVYPEEVYALERALEPSIRRLFSAQTEVREVVEQAAMGKRVKGDQLVALLGEVIAAKLMGGSIQASDEDPDIVVGGDTYEVKTRVHRKGPSWRASSSISAVDYPRKPNWLLFQELDEGLHLRRAWRFPWVWLVEKGHIRVKWSRGTQIGYYFRLSRELERDAEYLIFHNQ